MKCKPKWRASVERYFTAIILATSLLFTGANALAVDIGAIIKKLERSEWEIVSEAVIDRLPSLIKGTEERALFNEMMKQSQQVAAFAEALDSGDYKGLGALSGKILTGNLEKMVASRFGEDSRLYRSIQLVKKGDTDLAKALTRAALNTDAGAAKDAINKSLKQYAQNNVSKLRQQGINFWKDMYRGVIPLGDRLAALGVDPVDLYLQGISTWANFTEQARPRFNSTMLDCLAHKYREIRGDDNNHYAAREEIEFFDIGTGAGRDFRCSVAMDKLKGVTGDKGLVRSITDFLIDLGSSTVARTELGMTSGEIVDLIEQFEKEGGFDKHSSFSSWVQDRLTKTSRPARRD